MINVDLDEKERIKREILRMKHIYSKAGHIPKGFILIDEDLFEYLFSDEIEIKPNCDEKDETYESKRNWIQALPEIYLRRKYKKDLIRNAVNEIESILKKDGPLAITIQRQYLPEVIGAEILEISNDGFPVLNQRVLDQLKLRRIQTEIYSNMIKFTMQQKRNLMTRVIDLEKELDATKRELVQIKQKLCITENELKKVRKMKNKR